MLYTLIKWDIDKQITLISSRYKIILYILKFLLISIKPLNVYIIKYNKTSMRYYVILATSDFNPTISHRINYYKWKWVALLRARLYLYKNPFVRCDIDTIYIEK